MKRRMSKEREAAVVMATAVLAVALAVASAAASGCGKDQARKQGRCRDCIIKQVKGECPECRPGLRCMAGCLWNGVAPSKCVSTCDSPKGKKPTLADCKRCLALCKCSCLIN